MMKRLFVAVLFLALVGLPARALAETALETSTQWDCLWEEEGTDNLFECEMSLTIAADGSLSGSIQWTVVRGPSPQYDGKAGKTAVEYIVGTYSQTSNTMEFRGTSRDDPDEIIGLDVYRLEISPDGRWIFGPTGSNDTWKGRFHAVRR